MQVEAPPPRKAESRRAQGQPNAVKSELRRIADHSRPWWADAPAVAAMCLALAFAPVRYAVLAAEAAVSLAFAGAVAAIALWWIGYIPDATVAAALTATGDRVLAILQSSGIL